jgi:hypothetical protein
MTFRQLPKWFSKSLIIPTHPQKLHLVFSLNFFLENIMKITKLINHLYSHIPRLLIAWANVFIPLKANFADHMYALFNYWLRIGYIRTLKAF